MSRRRFLKSLSVLPLVPVVGEDREDNDIVEAQAAAVVAYGEYWCLQDWLDDLAQLDDEGGPYQEELLVRLDTCKCRLAGLLGIPGDDVRTIILPEVEAFVETNQARMRREFVKRYT